MIDWVAVEIPIHHPRLFAGTVLAIGADGVMDWESPRRFAHAGSYDHRIMLRSQGAVPGSPELASSLYIDGNLVKFLQGHNVDGPDCLATILHKILISLSHSLGLHLRNEDLYRICRGRFSVKRLDLTYYLYAGDTEADTDTFLRALGTNAGTKYRKAYTNQGTVYFNKGSGRWSCACYNKAKEMTKHKPPKFWSDQALPGQRDYKSNDFETLRQAVTGLVRWEFRVQSEQLKDFNASSGTVWVAGRWNPFKLWCKLMERVKVDSNVRLNSEQLYDLPTKVRGTYELWRSGSPVRELVSRATFYRHKSILREYGVNIDDHPDELEQAKVIPIVRYLEAGICKTGVTYGMDVWAA